MAGNTFKAFGVCMGLVAAACGADHDPADDPDEDREDQALLHDEPLTGAASTPIHRQDAIAPPFTLLPSRFWRFDDCTPDRAELFNSGSGDTAFRSVGVTCGPGARALGVVLAAKEDIVYVPDQPYFTFGAGVTIGAWFKPAHLDGTQTLIRKRDRGTSAFALVLQRGRFRFVVDLGNGHAASVTAPTLARAGELQHVAATYDGAALRLYVDGLQVAVRAAAGSIPPGPGPLLFGNDGSERRFDGTIDEVAFEVGALPADRVRQLTCFPAEPTVVATPAISAPTPPDVATTFDIAVTNHNPPACEPMEFDLSVQTPPDSVAVSPSPTQLHSPPVPSGSTTHFTFTATPFDTVDEPIHLGFEVSAFEWFFSFTGEVAVAVTDPPGCHVSKSRELLITHPSVVDDPIRTTTQGATDPRRGSWSFQHLVEEMAPTPGDAPAMVEDLLRSYLTRQIVNGLPVEPRPGMARFLAGWPRTPDGKLDLARAPIRLKAIVNRLDLRDLDHGNAGEGSFIFSLVEDGFELQATLIFEYKLPATTEADVLDWARAFHALGAMPFSEPYNVALQALTDRFVRRGARPGGVNGSALHAVRSNESPFGEGSGLVFELREFTLSPATGRLAPSALDRTPDQSFLFSFALDQFLADNRDAILAGTYTVPDQLDGQPFRAGAVNSEPGIWTSFDVEPAVRREFALGTCNGCHSLDETGTFFQHVAPRFGLSPFLRGVTVPDPVTGEPRTFNDLLRRRLDLEAIVCPAVPTVSLRSGIHRVH